MFKNFLIVCIFCLLCGSLISFKMYKQERELAKFDKKSFAYPRFMMDMDSKNIQKVIFNPEHSAHSSSIVDLGSKVMVVFFAGSKEGAKDVKIYQSLLDKDMKVISDTKAILDADMLSKMSGKFIKKLGNPVLVKSENTIYLFVVGVNLGGWATSKIYQLRFDERLSDLEFIEELKLGPLANLSHLIRSNAVLFENGGFILPFYHEMVDKYPLAAFFDESGKFYFAKRLNNLKQQLQPSIIALNRQECLAFFRNHKAYENTAFVQKCQNAGQIWQEPLQTNIKNYDTSSVLFTLDNDKRQEIFLIQNNGTKKHPRNSLGLFYLKNLEQDKGCFEYLLDLDNGKNELSYPSVSADENNLYLSYTYDRKNIKIQKLSFAFLQKLVTKD